MYIPIFRNIKNPVILRIVKPGVVNRFMTVSKSTANQRKADEFSEFPRIRNISNSRCTHASQFLRQIWMHPWFEIEGSRGNPGTMFTCRWKMSEVVFDCGPRQRDASSGQRYRPQICTILPRYCTAYLPRIFIMTPPMSFQLTYQSGGKFRLNGVDVLFCGRKYIAYLANKSYRSKTN